VLEGVYGHLAALAAHPLRPEFSVSGDAGVLWAWNYSSKQLVSTREFEKLRVSHLVYSSDGASLIVGCTNGTLRILCPNSLADKQVCVSPISARYAIFSHDSRKRHAIFQCQ
jgi:WD40 repeat protein